MVIKKTRRAVYNNTIREIVYYHYVLCGIYSLKKVFKRRDKLLLKDFLNGIFFYLFL